MYSRTLLWSCVFVAAIACLAAYGLWRRQKASDQRLAGLELQLGSLQQRLALVESRPSVPVVVKERPDSPPPSWQEVFRPLSKGLRTVLLSALEGSLSPAQRQDLSVVVDYASGQSDQLKTAQEFVDLLAAAGIKAKLGESRSFHEDPAEPFSVETHPKTKPAAQKAVTALAPFLNAQASWQSNDLLKIGKVRFCFMAAPRFLPDGALHYAPPLPVSVKGLSDKER